MTLSLHWVCLLPALVILWRLLHVVAVLDARHYRGQGLRYAVLLAHWTMISVGAVAAVLGIAIATPLLLTGAALLVLADRRRT